MKNNCVRPAKNQIANPKPVFEKSDFSRLQFAFELNRDSAES